MRHWIWFSNIGLSVKSELKLLERFETPERIYDETHENLKQVLKPGEVAAILSNKSLDRADDILAECISKQIQILTIRDAQYPDRLRNIDAPPIVLYVRGTLPPIDDEVTIAVVGTRKPTDRAKKTTRALAHDLARGGAIIVSGMAEGIDGAAHLGALDAGACTIAVFGCGVDICYPAFHDKLMEDILRYGCVVSEYAPGVTPERFTFPARNRIISGLSLGTLVVSAPHKSGSLITANLALEQGRDVFAVPGAIDDANFEGSNELIKSGATPVTNARDILDTYAFRYPQLRTDNQKNVLGGYLQTLKRIIGIDVDKKSTKAPDAEELCKKLSNENDIAIVKALADGELQIDNIAERTELPIQVILTRMTMLEMDGIVCQKPGKYFELVGK